MHLASITSGLNLVGVEPGVVVSVIAAVPMGPDSLKLIYQRPAGGYRDRLISRADADAFSVARAERPWAFDGNGEDFKLAVEAKTEARLKAHLLSRGDSAALQLAGQDRLINARAIDAKTRF
jgi:hypothetical protein